MSKDLSDYYNLLGRNLDDLQIVRSSQFDCQLVDANGQVYEGFLLAKSEKGSNYTICDISFQESGVDNKNQPRLIFRRTNRKMQNLKVRKDVIEKIIAFDVGQNGYREFWKMVAFLYKFREIIDLGEFFEKYKVVDSDSYIVKFTTKKEADKINDLRRMINNANLSDEQIKEILEDQRKEVLKEFSRLLENSEYWKVYRGNYESEIKGVGEESAWHHFLKKHKWVLGLNADIKFIKDLISEVAVGETNTQGRGNPMVDLLGILDYTILVELKTPNTRFFTKKKTSKSRCNTWSFSEDFIEGISQCLGQKFDWDKKPNKKLIDDNNRVDTESVRTIDPKTLLVIGNKGKYLPQESKDNDTLWKRDVLEKFRRNSRNVEIITYDELYYKSYYLIYDKEAPKLSYMENDDEIDLSEYDLPF